MKNEAYIPPPPPVQASNEIWYTSSDGNIVTPLEDSFEANIVSNTYENGKGIIKFDNYITSIGEYAFSDCTSLTSITIPDSVTEIGYCAFAYCESLTSVTIPDSVTSIGYDTFAGCSSLTSIKIPDSVTEIGTGVFANCSSLTSVTIPNSVTSIESNAFAACESLTSVTIPDSVISIEVNVFSGCLSLTSVYCKPITPPSGNSGMFDYNASDRMIYVPRNSVSIYKSAFGWDEYASDIVGYDF